MFEGGYSQFGCGTATDLAATVLASASGVPSAIVLTTADVSLTQSPSSLATPTTLGTASGSSTSATASPSSATSETTGTLTTITIPSPATTTEPSSLTESASTGSSSSTSSTGVTPTAAPGTSTGSDGGSNHTGAIVGGSIGGLAALVGIAAVAAYFYRRRLSGNSRQGPGPRPGDTQYISPMSGGAAFAPLGSNSDSHSGQSATVRGKTITHITGGPGQNSLWHNEGDMTDYQFLENHPGTAWAPAGAAAAAAGAGGYRGAYASPHDSGDDEVPLRHGSPEIEDFTQGFHDALSRIGEEDEEDMRDEVNGAGMSGNNQGTGDLGESSRPLWLQSRRQSRNLMWT